MNPGKSRPSGTDRAASLTASFAPGEGESAVLSLLLVGDDTAGWTVASGSLLTGPPQIASNSWRGWEMMQPSPWPPYERHGFDLKPEFTADPFPGVRIHRATLSLAEWKSTAAGLGVGQLPLRSHEAAVGVRKWSSTVLVGTGGLTAAHDVTQAMRRPLDGVLADLEPVEMPATEGLWRLAAPVDAGQPPMRDRQGHLANWPLELLGLNWHGGREPPPPPAFFVGRARQEAWIAGVVPDYEDGELHISLGWDAERLDPLGCSLLMQNERDGLSQLTWLTRVSDLPRREDDGTAPQQTEARDLPWDRRLLTVALPRGPRRSEWGVTLIGSNGRVLDQRAVAPRFERVEISFRIEGSDSETTSSSGDPDGPPTLEEQDEAAKLAGRLDGEARQAAAQRRLSTAGELGAYLRWRLSARAGELLVLDPILVKHDTAEVIDFLVSLRRPIRALTAHVPPEIAPLLEGHPKIDIRALPQGKHTLHDRVWLVGETGLLVGGSANTFLPGPKGKTPATTATEMPAADVREWHDQFAAWWPSTRPRRAAG